MEKFGINLSSLHRQSLKTRVTLFAAGIIWTGIRSLAFCASRVLRNAIQRLLGIRQFSTVSLTDTRTFLVEFPGNWKT